MHLPSWPSLGFEIQSLLEGVAETSPGPIREPLETNWQLLSAAVLPACLQGALLLRERLFRQASASVRLAKRSLLEGRVVLRKLRILPGSHQSVENVFCVNFYIKTMNYFILN